MMIMHVYNIQGLFNQSLKTKVLVVVYNMHTVYEQVIVFEKDYNKYRHH
jgi:hypothetical protein